MSKRPPLLQPSAQPLALHVAPGAGDECCGAGAHLLTLRAAGWRVVNFTVDDHAESDAIAASCQQLGLETLRSAPYQRDGRPVSFAQMVADDPSSAQSLLALEISQLIEQGLAQLVISPAPQAGCAVHEVCALAVGEAIADHAQRHGSAPVWWQWSWYVPLKRPTLLADVSAQQLDELQGALRHYEPQTPSRAELLRARATLCLAFAPQRDFGELAINLNGRGAEVVRELALTSDGWWLTAPRLLDSSDVLPARLELLRPWASAG